MIFLYYFYLSPCVYSYIFTYMGNHRDETKPSELLKLE